MKQKISLALGGGGSKGAAHIGVLRVVEQQGYQIAAIAGTSVGGLIAAVYLSGNSPDEMEQLLTGTEFRKLFRGSRKARKSLLGLAGVADLLSHTIGNIQFEDLTIPLALTAVDLKTGQEVVLNSGSVREAVFATIAVPGIFPPREIGDYDLVDGGISNPVPVSMARDLARSVPVIAVPLSSSPSTNTDLPETNLLGPIPGIRRMTHFRLGQAFQVFTRSMTISSRLLTELRLQLDQPDLIIRPDVDHIGLLDRVNVAEVVRLGEEAALKSLPQLPQQRAWWQRLRSSFMNPRQPESN
jgi:NTE family protein